jgi:3',5'-cyclic AMP phosphodiesterase CpdA
MLAPVVLNAHDPDPGFRSGADTTGGISPWTNLGFYADPDNFQFAIVTDRTGGRRPGVFAEAVDRLNLLKPEFVICVGDLIDGYTEDDTELSTQWAEFDSLVNRLDMPFFYVPGNHDISNEVMIQDWKTRRGRPYYHFQYRDVLFLVLDTEDPPPAGIGDEQVAYFQKVLSEETGPRHILLFMHRPLWLRDEPLGFDRIESLLVGRRYTVFAGHHHTYGKFTRFENRYYKLGTTGGGSSLAGPGSGQFDHVVWVTMADEGPLMANLMLDGIYDDDPDVLPPEPPNLAVVSRAPRASIHVDGDAADWDGLESDSVDVSLGPGHLGCRIQYAWDERYLFVLIREIGGDMTDGEATDAAMFMDVVWKHEGISLFMDFDNSAPHGDSRPDADLWFGFSSTGRHDLHCLRTHRTPPEQCSQNLLSQSIVATSGRLGSNSRVIEAALSWADLEASVDNDRLPGGFLPTVRPGLRIGIEPLLLDDGHVLQTFIGGSRTRSPNGRDENSRDILLVD